MSAIDRVRKKVSDDMDHRLELHGSEWDYAQELIQFIDMVKEEEKP